ncbi:MAG: PKD domain-containing protein, partial [Candidatus Krumholzibacteriales bacterium]
MDGKVGLGLYGGAYKLVLTDHSDLWTPGWLAGADLKYGLTPGFAIGIEGSWMQTYLADLSEGTRMQDGAGLTFENVNDGPRQRAYVTGLFAEYRFMADKRVSPVLFAGPGIYFWKWADKDGNTLFSDDPALAVAYLPQTDKAGNAYELKDQELYLMGGAGMELSVTQSLSLELGAKFRYLTHLLSDFTDDKDIVGSDPGQLDLPKGIVELYTGVTFYFGGKECPPLFCTASGNPTSGQAPLAVQFNGSHRGGCPDYTYAWNFGDGGTSNEKNPSHTYYSEGNYSASLTVTDSKNTSSENSVYVTVECPKLVVTASGDPTSGTAPLSVKFDGSATGGCPNYTFAWDFGDGKTSNERNPIHVYRTEGDYTALLTVTDSKNNTQQKSVSIKSSAEEYIPTPEKPLVLQGVKFEFDKSTLTADSRKILDRVAASLLAHPEVKVEVGGHTDSVGSEEYNRNLSEQRAKAVRDYLVNKGVPG